MSQIGIAKFAPEGVEMKRPRLRGRCMRSSRTDLWKVFQAPAEGDVTRQVASQQPPKSPPRVPPALRRGRATPARFRTCLTGGSVQRQCHGFSAEGTRLKATAQRR